MTDHDVVVATPPDRQRTTMVGWISRSRSSSSTKHALTASIWSAREGCWLEITKLVLETGVEVELTEHLGYDGSTTRLAATAATRATGPGRRR